MDIHFLYPRFIWGMFGAAWALGRAIFFLHPSEQHLSPEKLLSSARSCFPSSGISKPLPVTAGFETCSCGITVPACSAAAPNYTGQRAGYK